MKIKIGDTVIMPEPSPDDNWLHGGFAATVIDIVQVSDKLDLVETLIVQDQDTDTFMIEPERVELA